MRSLSFFASLVKTIFPAVLLLMGLSFEARALKIESLTFFQTGNAPCSGEARVHLKVSDGHYIPPADSIYYTVSGNRIMLHIRFPEPLLTVLSERDTTVMITGLFSGTYLLQCNVYANDWGTGKWRHTDSACRALEIINEIPSFDPFAEPVAVICSDKNERLVLDAGPGFSTYRWSPGGESTEEIMVGLPGRYEVTVTDSRGCEMSDSIVVEDKCPAILHVPDAFSPNDDGINDVFKTFGRHVLTFEMKIYSRWGELLFESHDLDHGWNGKIGEKPLPQGVYLYYIRFNSHFKEGQLLSGTAALVK